MSLRIEIEDHIAVVTLDRPKAMNSIDPKTRAQLAATWKRIHTDQSIRVVILTGAGDRAFCTGSDLKKTMPPAESFAEIMFDRADSDHLLAGLTTDKPLICAINGYAMGGGMEIALACDIRIASENAEFALSEVRIGSIPGAGGTQRLPRAVGASDAMLMLLTGDRIDAREALRIGLISKVVPRAELMGAAKAIAQRIAQNAPLAVRAVKRLALQGLDMPLAAAMESERYVFGLLRDTKDRIEGRVSFQEKRPPNFQGK